jgi:hypothetical protein
VMRVKHTSRRLFFCVFPPLSHLPHPHTLWL